MNEIKENFGNISKEFPDIKHSKKNMASYGFGKSIVESSTWHLVLMPSSFTNLNSG